MYNLLSNWDKRKKNFFCSYSESLCCINMSKLSWCNSLSLWLMPSVKISLHSAYNFFGLSVYFVSLLHSHHCQSNTQATNRHSWVFLRIRSQHKYWDKPGDLSDIQTPYNTGKNKEQRKQKKKCNCKDRQSVLLKASTLAEICIYLSWVQVKRRTTLAVDLNSSRLTSQLSFPLFVFICETGNGSVA